MRFDKKLIVRLAVGSSLLAATRFPYCSNEDLLRSPIGLVNPCGSVLNCDPNDYVNLVSGVNRALDGSLGPADFCTISYYCGPQPQVERPIQNPDGTSTSPGFTEP